MSVSFPVYLLIRKRNLHLQIATDLQTFILNPVRRDFPNFLLEYFCHSIRARFSIDIK